MTIEVFPVQAITGPLERNGRGKPCRRRGTWYRDTHGARRGAWRHHAQDIFAASGSPIVAPQSGVIVDSSATRGPTPKGGHFVRLVATDPSRPTRGVAYWMSHLLEEPLVGKGQRVEAGQRLGLLGRTGNAERTCPHLHIGARLAWFNPERTRDMGWRFGRALNIYEQLKAVDPDLAGPPIAPAVPARTGPLLPTAGTPCPDCGHRRLI